MNLKYIKKDAATRALYEANINPQQFAPEHLKITYQMFRYRIREGRLSLDDYHKILHYTGRTFEDLFPNPYSTTPQPIKLNLSPMPVPASRLPQVQKEIPKQPVIPQPVASPLEEKKEVFKIEDVYAGGLPTDEQTTY